MKYIAICGTVGSGKTTMLGKLLDHFGARASFHEERPQDGSFQPPSETEAPEDADAASGSSQDIQTASGEDNAARPQRPDDNAADNPASTGTDRTQLVLLGACVLALL